MQQIFYSLKKTAKHFLTINDFLSASLHFAIFEKKSKERFEDRSGDVASLKNK